MNWIDREQEEPPKDENKRILIWLENTIAENEPICVKYDGNGYWAEPVDGACFSFDNFRWWMPGPGSPYDNWDRLTQLRKERKD